ncbi:MULTISPECIES: hypothetical protein [Aerosakkonema]|uniref:hypothetical protein n=1 Tax=Aerosakkonema TaxID=1246629 RepID=UPI0035B7E852
MTSQFARYRVRSCQLKNQSFLARIPISALMSTATVLLLIDMVVDGGVTSFLAFGLGIIGTASVIWPREINKFFNGFWHWQRRHKVNILPLLCTVIVTLWWLDITSAPAHAQFFIQTENWLRSAFPINGATGGTGAGGTDIYSVVFNTLRAIFVLYLAVALVRVIAAARNDEDWQSLARTPLIILVTVTLGDILAGLITGGAAGGPGAAP